ncbi:Mnn10p [Sugiyamaella lignohabitans]|uniref:Mnn10p n=1 Tax=Sugiyamaella lignohabitans TaxID=796027 RepID=A0A167CN25_9ASCO|nr:Mnn10p [Sugiyamaella lignohabitans]ANB11906.1 Mnn10p [Sugiyamaella lignohabitans]
MRLSQTVFLACSAAAILATIWYMAAFNSIDGVKWPASPNRKAPPKTDTPVLSDTEKQLERLMEAIHQKNEELGIKESLVKEKEEALAEMEHQRKVEIAAQEAKAKKEEEEKAERKKKMKELADEIKKKQKEEEEKKKKQREDEEKERKRLSDAFWLIRERLAKEEAGLLRPVEVPQELRDKYTDDNNKLVPNSKQVLLLSAFNNSAESSDNMTRKVMINRDEYCKYHGYTHLFINTTRYIKQDQNQRSPRWWKIPAIKEAFKKHPEAEWIWYADYDIMITNEMVDLAQHLLNPYILAERITYGSPVNSLGDQLDGLRVPPRDHFDVNKVDIIFSQDFFGINTASFFIRRSVFTEFLLDIWDDPFFMDKEWLREEQDAFVFLYQHYKVVFEHTAIVPQRGINSYHKYKTETGSWQKDDLALNFAVPSEDEKRSTKELFDTYFIIRKKVPEEFQIN